MMIATLSWPMAALYLFGLFSLVVGAGHSGGFWAQYRGVQSIERRIEPPWSAYDRAGDD